MPPITEILNAQQIEGALLVVALWFLFKSTDILLKKWIDKKIFSTIYEKARKKFKAWRTKHRGIEADLEFSAYLYEDLSKSEFKHRLDSVLQNLKQRGRGDVEISSVHEGRKSVENGEKFDFRIEANFRNKEQKYDIRLNVVEKRLSSEKVIVESVGVSTKFRFAFSDLRSEIIDLIAFINYFKNSIEEEYNVKNITNSRFVVTPIEADLTLDEWVKQEQFDVSLLLESDDSSRAVRFYGDSAVITSPTDQVDNETVEYIRATLLNYYL